MKNICIIIKKFSSRYLPTYIGEQKNKFFLLNIFPKHKKIIYVAVSRKFIKMEHNFKKFVGKNFAKKFFKKKLFIRSQKDHSTKTQIKEKQQQTFSQHFNPFILILRQQHTHPLYFPHSQNNNGIRAQSKHCSIYQSTAFGILIGDQRRRQGVRSISIMQHSECKSFITIYTTILQSSKLHPVVTRVIVSIYNEIPSFTGINSERFNCKKSSTMRKWFISPLEEKKNSYTVYRLYIRSIATDHN